ncbi:MAG: pentapeptide repeat-containing protein [Candidatus Aenigmarchaeota archaeon]|nr:pentapeptide repeat-containing protein [Candidatus Aenigmarchaeota archaeon]
MDAKKIVLVAVLSFLVLIIPVFAANYNLTVYTYDKNTGVSLGTDYIKVLDSSGNVACRTAGAGFSSLICNLPKAQYTIQAYNPKYNPMVDTFTLRSDQTRHLFLVPDITLPISALSASGTKGNPINGVDWYTTAVVVDISCSDASGSGCNKIYATLGKDSYVSQSGQPLSIQVNSDGSYTLKYYSVDMAGNRENEKEYVFGVDTTPPVIAGAGSDWTNVAQQFNPSCSDPESGCGTFFGYVSSTVIAQCPATPASYNVPLPAAVSTHVFWCAGAANNVGLFSFTPLPFEFKVDLVPPVVTSRDIPNGTVYSPSQVYWFNATISDNEVLQTVEFDLDGQRFLPTNDNGEYGINFVGLGAGTHSYRWRAVDMARNDHVFVNNLVITKAPTSMSLTVDGSSLRQMIDVDTQFTLRAELNASGLLSITSDFPWFSQISSQSPTQSAITFNNTGTFTITADFAGDNNYLPSSASIIIDSVERPDTEAPVLVFVSPLNESTVQTSTVPIEFTVSDANPYTINLSIDGATPTVITGSTTLNLSQNSVHTLTFSLQDILGNTANYVLQFTIPILSTVSDSIIDGVNFTGDVLNALEGRSTFVRSEIVNSTVSISNLTDSRLVRSTIENTNLTNSKVTDATLKNSVLLRSTFIGKEAEDVFAEDSFLDPGNFTGSKFKNCNIVNSNVTYSNVADCSITDSNVNGSVIVGSTFNLKSYVFNNSDVHGIDGTGVNITNDKLVSGTVTYKGNSFTAPMTLSDIYNYVASEQQKDPGPWATGGGGGGGGFTPVYSVSASADGSSFDMKQGDVNRLTVELENKGNMMLTGLTFTLTEIPANWYSFEGLPASLEAGQKTNITVVFAPTGVSADKTGKLLVNSTEGAVSEVPVSIKFTGSAPQTTTTIPEVKVNATLPGTTTTTTVGPNPLTGFFTVIGGNPAAVAVVGIVLVVIGSIGWSMRSDSAKKKRAAVAEAEETEQEGNNN